MKNSDLLQTLSNCINHCNYCADACLNEDKVEMMADCIRADRVCASVCASLADILATEYKNVQGLVDFCAETCEACAQECGKHDPEHCQACARACKACAESCRKFSA